MYIHSALSQCFPVAFGLYALGMLVAIVQGKKANTKLCSVLLLIGSLCLTAGAILGWPQRTVHISKLYIGGLEPFSQVLDPLSSIFMVLLGTVASAAAIFSPAYLNHLKDRFHRGIYWFSFFTFVLGIANLLLASNAVAFIVFWEIMSLSCVALVVTDHVSHRARNAALIYLGATRISTSLLLTGFVWMHALTGSWTFSDWYGIGHEATAPLIVIFFGLCIKAGIWPFHQWLPSAHPEAPSPVSALMSGVMVKTAIYAMIRILGFSAAPVVAVAYIAIALGSVSSFWGILFALMERDLKRLLAYSTVENVGLIVLALGITLLAKSAGLTPVASIAIAACLLHCINHCFYKALLFLCAGSVDAGAHSRDLGQLGGLQKGMKFTTALFFVGALSICALPPLNGFASKWLIYQSLFHFAIDGGTVLDRALSLAIVGLLSMVGALSVASFAKAFGLGFLGRPRSQSAELAHEPSSGTVSAQVLLSIPCLALGVLAPAVLRLLEPVGGAIVPGYNSAGIFTLPQPQLMLAMAELTVLIYALVLSGKSARVKRYVTWDCGYGPLPVRTLINPTSYSLPLANLFRPILQHKITSQIKGRDRRHFPDSIKIEEENIPLLTKLVYMPAVRTIEAASRGLIRLQTGSIHVHLLYVFATLLALAVIGTHL